MCYKDANLPFLYPLELRNIGDGTQRLTVSMLLGKVTTKRNGEHISSMGLLYPIRQTIHDTKAKEGSHSQALHFAATPECNIALPDSFGSHRLAVLPGPQIWDPLKEEEPVSRCWHSDGCTPIFCMDCWNLKPEDLNNPDFWRAFKKSCEQSDDSVLRIPRDQIWHQQIVVTPN
jgi:hypothetical protein